MISTENSPFNLSNDKAYLQWRELKLTNAKTNSNKRIIHLNIKKTSPHLFDGFLLKGSEVKETDHNHQSDTSYTDKLLYECNIDNYCLYHLEDHEKYNSEETKQLIHDLAKICGLSRLDSNICADDDSLTSICRTTHQDQHEYIPYSNKKMSWHTDGYYNLPKNTINSMLLHCFQNAYQGGESAFIDHEIVYILLRDKNPKWIKALCHPTSMTIPANVLNGKIIRAEQTGPVFTVSQKGRLHMRYSARQRNIVWRQDDSTLEALSYLQELLNPDITSDSINRSEYIIRHKFKPGEGIISRNVLHCRSAFDENETTDSNRLLFRGRFYDELPQEKERQRC